MSLLKTIDTKVFGSMFPELDENDIRICRGIYLRSRYLAYSYNRTKGQGRGILYILHPFLQELYKDDPEELMDSYHRYNSYFICRFQFIPFICAIMYQMEASIARGEDIPRNSINDVKVALMGPLSGIGDPIFQVVQPMIITGMTLGLSLNGNPAGPILYMIFTAIFTWFFYAYFSFLGYSLGTKAVDAIISGGLIDKFTKAAAVLGLTMMGAVCAQQMNIRLNWTPSIGGISSNIQTDIIDLIEPRLLSLVCVFAVYGLLNKGVTVGKLIVGIFVLNIVMALLGMY